MIYYYCYFDILLGEEVKEPIYAKTKNAALTAAKRELKTAGYIAGRDYKNLRIC